MSCKGQICLKHRHYPNGFYVMLAS